VQESGKGEGHVRVADTEQMREKRHRSRRCCSNPEAAAARLPKVRGTDREQMVAIKAVIANAQTLRSVQRLDTASGCVRRASSLTL
jgi:hypothetical protein